MPFHWSVNLLYNIMFGALPTYRDLSAGILILYAAFFCLLFIGVSLYYERKSSSKSNPYDAVGEAQKQEEREP